MMTSMGKAALGAIAISWATFGCNQPESDSTKSQLQQVTAERDSLKTQLDATKQENAATQQQLAQSKSAAAATTVAPATEATTAQDEKLSHPPRSAHSAATTEAKASEIKAKHRAM